MFGKKIVAKQTETLNGMQYVQYCKAMDEMDKLSLMTNLRWHSMTEKGLTTYICASFIEGLIIGGVVGAAAICAVAVYITKKDSITAKDAE